MGKAGLYGIVASQSNDFALGYPLLVSLYKNTHSNYSSFLALTGPLQVLAVNPAGFVMLEMSKQTQSDSRSRCGSIITIIKGTFSNPIVAMTIIGLIWNFAFDHAMPLAIAPMIDTIGAAFSSAALVLLGHSMAGKISTFRGSFVLTPVLLIFTKNIIFPLLLQRVIVLFSHGSDLEETQDLSSLGFLYGTIPCGPAVFVFACQYDLSIDVIASTIIFSTLCSAPIMFATATMTILSTQQYEHMALYMESVIGYISLISFISCLWLLLVFLMGKRWESRGYGATTYLVLAQLIASVGGVLCFFRNNKDIYYAQYIMAFAGITGTRIWISVLALLLFLSHWKNEPAVLRAKYAVNIAVFVASFCFAFLLAGVLLINKSFTGNSNPNFPLGYAQVCLTAVITGLCLLMTAVCLALHHKYKTTADSSGTSEPSCETAEIWRSDARQSAVGNYRTFESHIDGNAPIYKSGGCVDLSSPCYTDSGLTDPKSTADTSAIRTRINCGPCVCRMLGYSSCILDDEEAALNQETAEQNGSQNVNSEESSRIFRHVLLLMVLNLSILVAFFLCLWKLFVEATNGIFIELEFLDVALTYGQGIIYFLIFGLDSVIVRPFEKLRRHIQCWCSTLSFPRLLTETTDFPAVWGLTSSRPDLVL